MKTFTKAVCAAVGAVSLVLSLSACTAPLPNGNGNCDFSVDYPHGSTTKAGYIDGKGKVTCTYTKGSLTNLHIETHLQKWNGSSWATVSGTDNTTTQATVKSGVTYTGVSGFVRCQSGTFRTESRGYGYLDGKKSQSVEWQTTDTRKGVKNPCTKPLQIVSVG
jgi:hypothetical protein